MNSYMCGMQLIVKMPDYLNIYISPFQADLFPFPPSTTARHSDSLIKHQIKHSWDSLLKLCITEEHLSVYLLCS